MKRHISMVSRTHGFFFGVLINVKQWKCIRKNEMAQIRFSTFARAVVKCNRESEMHIVDVEKNGKFEEENVYKITIANFKKIPNTIDYIAEPVFVVVKTNKQNKILDKDIKVDGNVKPDQKEIDKVICNFIESREARSKE